MSVDADARPLRVLIVDDTADLRDLLRFALTRHGFEVVAEAGNGQEGIDRVVELDPDLVLLDMAMPVMDGLEALPHMRRARPLMKIIVLSGFGAAEMTRRAVAAGADGYLQKGASILRLVSYIREITDGSAEPRPTAVPSLTLVPEEQPHSEPDTAAGRDCPVALAPFGIVEVEDAPGLRVLSANPAATTLLGVECAPPARLGDLAPRLAELVSFHRLQDGALLELPAESGRGRTAFRLRRTSGSLLLYAEPGDGDGSTLRRAIAATAHEIRHPTTTILGIAEALETSEAGMTAEQRHRMLASVVGQARLLDRVTADLLTAAQAQHGTLRAEPVSVQPSETVGHVVAHRERIRVDVSDPRPVLADPARLQQMLENLMSNAEKYALAPYSVTVRPEHGPEKGPERGRVCIDVEDSGPGVPSEFREHLFEEFSRAGGAQAPGTGLGLYVVRTLAEAQGGAASYAPRPGGGSVFTVALPAG